MRNRKRTDYIVAHVTATPPTMDIGMKEVTAMHRRLKWATSGYACVIRRDGHPEFDKHGLNIARNHVRGFNSISIGVSMVGGVDKRGRAENNMTPAQFKTLEEIVNQWQDRFTQAGFCGHRDLSPDRDGDGIIEPHEHLKACPCFDAIPWGASKGLRVAPIRGLWSKGTTKKIKPPDIDVIEVQRKLVAAGYEIGPVDGIWGPKTDKAYKHFTGKK